MREWIIPLIIVLLFNTILCYACCVAAKMADERAEKMNKTPEQERTCENEKVLEEDISAEDYSDRRYSGLWSDD